MRLLAILSPTDKWGTKTEYTKLRKILLNDGYIRIASEVFMRVVQNRKASEKHYRRIDEIKPKTGVVRLIRLTEKQYILSCSVYWACRSFTLPCRIQE